MARDENPSLFRRRELYEGGGYGILVDIILGILGGILGGWIFGLLGIWSGRCMIGSIIVAFIGAMILVGITRLLKSLKGCGAVSQNDSRLQTGRVTEHQMRAAGAQDPCIRRAIIVAGILFALGVAATPRIFGSGFAEDVSEALQEAQRQFNVGNYSAAITTLQSVVQQNPTSAEAFFWLGRSYHELHDYNNAIAQLEKSTQLDAKNSQFHRWLGIAYGAKADRERSFSVAKKVKKEFQNAVQLDPSNIQARMDLMEFCVSAPWIVGGSKDEAQAQIEAIEKLDPMEGHLARGKYYLVEKKPDQAEREYREVLAANPKRVEAYFDVAEFYVGQNKAPELQTTIDAAAQIGPNDPRLAYYRGVQRVLPGTDQAHGEEYLKAYLESTPDRSDWPSHALARDWLGRLYQAEGKRTEAADQYRAALQLDPTLKDTKARLKQLEKNSK